MCQLPVGMSKLVNMSAGVSKCMGIFLLRESFCDRERGQVNMI